MSSHEEWIQWPNEDVDARSSHEDSSPKGSWRSSSACDHVENGEEEGAIATHKATLRDSNPQRIRDQHAPDSSSATRLARDTGSAPAAAGLGDAYSKDDARSAASLDASYSRDGARSAASLGGVHARDGARSAAGSGDAYSRGGVRSAAGSGDVYSKDGAQSAASLGGVHARDGVRSAAGSGDAYSKGGVRSAAGSGDVRSKDGAQSAASLGGVHAREGVRSAAGSGDAYSNSGVRSAAGSGDVYSKDGARSAASLGGVRARDGVRSAAGSGDAYSKGGARSAAGSGDVYSKDGAQSAAGLGGVHARDGARSAAGSGDAYSKGDVRSSAGLSDAYTRDGVRSAAGLGDARSKDGARSAAGSGRAYTRDGARATAGSGGADGDDGARSAAGPSDAHSKGKQSTRRSTPASTHISPTSESTRGVGGAAAVPRALDVARSSDDALDLSRSLAVASASMSKGFPLREEAPSHDGARVSRIEARLPVETEDWLSRDDERETRQVSLTSGRLQQLQDEAQLGTTTDGRAADLGAVYDPKPTSRSELDALVAKHAVVEALEQRQLAAPPRAHPQRHTPLSSARPSPKAGVALSQPGILTKTVTPRGATTVSRRTVTVVPPGPAQAQAPRRSVVAASEREREATLAKTLSSPPVPSARSGGGSSVASVAEQHTVQSRTPSPAREMRLSESSIAQFRREIAFYQQELLKRQEAADFNEADKQFYSRELQRWEQKVLDLEQRNNELSAHVADLKERNDALLEDRTKLQDELHKARKLTDDMEHRHMEQTSVWSDQRLNLEKQILNGEEKHLVTEKRITKLEEECRKANQRHQEAMDEILEKNLQISDYEAKSRTMLGTVNEAMNAMEQSFKLAEAEKAKTQEASEVMKTTQKLLNFKVESLEEDNERLQREVVETVLPTKNKYRKHVKDTLAAAEAWKQEAHAAQKEVNRLLEVVNRNDKDKGLLKKVSEDTLELKRTLSKEGVDKRLFLVQKAELEAIRQKMVNMISCYGYCLENRDMCAAAAFAPLDASTPNKNAASQKEVASIGHPSHRSGAVKPTYHHLVESGHTTASDNAGSDTAEGSSGVIDHGAHTRPSRAGAPSPPHVRGRSEHSTVHLRSAQTATSNNPLHDRYSHNTVIGVHSSDASEFRRIRDAPRADVPTRQRTTTELHARRRTASQVGTRPSRRSIAHHDAVRDAVRATQGSTIGAYVPPKRQSSPLVHGTRQPSQSATMVRTLSPPHGSLGRSFSLERCVIGGKERRDDVHRTVVWHEDEYVPNAALRDASVDKDEHVTSEPRRHVHVAHDRPSLRAPSRPISNEPKSAVMNIRTSSVLPVGVMPK